MKRAICDNLCQENMSFATKENFDKLKDRFTLSLIPIFLSTLLRKSSKQDREEGNQPGEMAGLVFSI